MKSKTIAAWLNALSIIILVAGIIGSLYLLTLKVPRNPGAEWAESVKLFGSIASFFFSLVLFFVLQALQRIISLIRDTLVEQNSKILRTLVNLDYDISGIMDSEEEEENYIE